MPARRRRIDTKRHECIVIGAGLLGLSTARSLARRGREVLVLESTLPGHPRSGSKGNARIFRLGYPDPLYVRMAAAAKDLWQELESESGRTLLHTTGQVTFGRDSGAIGEAMAEVGAPYTPLSPAETASRFPHLRLDGPSLLEESSGVLVADDCLRACLESGSFELRTQADVRWLHDGIDEHDGHDGITVVLAENDHHLLADVVVNCAGPRALSLLPGVHRTRASPPSLQQVAYFATPKGDPALPIFIEWDDDMVYGLPAIGQGVYKLSHHSLGPAVGDAAVAADADADDIFDRDDPELLARLVGTARRLLPTLDPVPVATERCLYDNTADTDFVIDRVGRIVVGCGTSGHGFKFGPLLGELLADLATGTEPSFDLGRFALSRSTPSAFPNP